MNIVIFGANGRTGAQLVQQALDANHSVTAFVRTPAKLSIKHPNLRIAQGDVLSALAVATAVEGHDVVLSALSATEGEQRSIFVSNIIAAMKQHGVKRILAIAGMGVLQANEHVKLFETTQFPEAYRPVSIAHWEACKLLVASGLDWTLVCPPMIPDGPKTGSYITKANYHTGGNTITTGDLAHFMVREMADNKFVNARVGISNG